MTTPSAPPGPPALDPTAVLQSKAFLGLLALGAIVGVPVAAVAYFFLEGVSRVQQEIYVDLPTTLGYHGAPWWWPLPWLALSGVLVALAITYLPGTGGHEPSEGLKSGSGIEPVELFGIFAAAFATLALGVVLGPEAPLIAIGGGLGVWAVRLLKRDANPMAGLVIGAAGSFTAIATLLGSPLVGAFLLMEMIGLGGQLMEVVLIPGLLAAGVGSLIFVGLNSLTGFGTFSLAISSIPPVGAPTAGEFGWAIVIGVLAAGVATAVFRSAQLLRVHVERRRLVLTPLAGLAIGGLAIAFAEATGRDATEVLFSGQSAMPELVQHAAGWTVGALVLLTACKALAYTLSLSGFRGGPIFPSMFIGVAGGIALSHLPGLPMIAGAAMGVGAMTAGALKMPLTAVLLPSLLFVTDAISLMPVVIVAVVVAYVIAMRINPPAPAPPSPLASG